MQFVNFKLIYTEIDKIKKSDYHMPYKKVLGLQVYKVPFDDSVYIVNNNLNKTFYTFRQINSDGNNVDSDLKQTIKAIKNKVSSIK